MKEIPLTQGKVALVDDEDFEYLNQWKWRAGRFGNKFYAARHPPRDKQRQTTILMHRLIMNAPENLEVDHRNLNGLDNQKSNLRLATHGQNMMNRENTAANKSSCKGVILEKRTQKWVARIGGGCRKNYIHIGTFATFDEAVSARKEAEQKYYGEFARK